MMSSAFHDTVDSMLLIRNKAHDSLLKKKSLYWFHLFHLLEAIAHSVRLLSVLMVDLVFSGRIPMNKKVESLLPNKEEDLLVHIMYAELIP